MVIATDRTTPFQIQVFGPPLPGFSVDKSVSLSIVTVRNIRTGEVVRQLPSEAAVKMAHHLDTASKAFYTVRVFKALKVSKFSQVFSTPTDSLFNKTSC